MTVQALYSAATGMSAMETKLDVIANNLANIETTGFKRSRPNFEDLFYRHEMMPGATDADGNFTATGCRDTQFAPGQFAWSDLTLRVYAKNTGHPGTSNRFEGRFETFYTAKNSLVIQALSCFGSTKGVSFPYSSCNELHVDLSKPALYYAANASNDQHGHVKSILNAVPFRPEYAGWPVWGQAAWLNSGTARIELTRACKTEVPLQPPSQYQRFCVYYWDAVRSSGIGPYPDDHLNPIIRYTYQ